MAEPTIDLNFLIDDIESHWNKIGLTREEKTTEKDALDASVTKVFTDCLAALDLRCREMQSAIENVQQAHLTLLQTFSETDLAIPTFDQPENSTISLRSQLQAVTRAYEADKTKYESDLARVQTLKKEAVRLFEALEISDEEKVEWATFDVKFTAARIQSLETLVESLTIDYTMRQDAILHANKEIATFSAELEIEIPNDIVNIFATNSLKHSSISHVTAYSQHLQTLREARIEQISGMATEIMKLWCLLGVDPQHQQDFLHAHSTLSASVVDDCAKEIQRLNAIQAEKLPVLITEQEIQIQEYCARLHIVREKRVAEEEPLITYERNASDLKNFALLSEKMQPALDLIHQREETLGALQPKVECANPKAVAKKPDAKEDQRRRRLKTVLPRLEKRLMTALIEFREIHGFDLEWDGRPYVQNLTHVILSDIEIRTIRAKARKKSVPEAGAPGACGPRKSVENLRPSLVSSRKVIQAAGDDYEE
jgi:hypothetical protein